MLWQDNHDLQFSAVLSLRSGIPLFIRRPDVCPWGFETDFERELLALAHKRTEPNG